MVVMNVRFNKKNILTAFAVIIALIIIVVIAFSGFGNSSESPETVVLNGTTEEERISFLLSYGYKTTGESVESHDVVIPYNFDATYEEYNNLQKSQGFNLKDYCGMRLTEYSYEISNYEGYDGIVYGNLLICEGQIVGGDIAAAELDGFMHSFNKELYLSEKSEQ